MANMGVASVEAHCHLHFAASTRACVETWCFNRSKRENYSTFTGFWRYFNYFGVKTVNDAQKTVNNARKNRYDAFLMLFSKIVLMPKKCRHCV